MDAHVHIVLLLIFRPCAELVNGQRPFAPAPDHPDEALAVDGVGDGASPLYIDKGQHVGAHDEHLGHNGQHILLHFAP